MGLWQGSSRNCDWAVDGDQSTSRGTEERKRERGRQLGQRRSYGLWRRESGLRYRATSSLLTHRKTVPDPIDCSQLNGGGRTDGTCSRVPHPSAWPGLTLMWQRRGLSLQPWDEWVLVRQTPSKIRELLGTLTCSALSRTSTVNVSRRKRIRQPLDTTIHQNFSSWDTRNEEVGSPKANSCVVHFNSLLLILTCLLYILVDHVSLLGR